MKTKNLFLATILVAFGAVNENIAQTVYSGTGNMRFGWAAGNDTMTGAYNIFMGTNSGTNNAAGGGNVCLGTWTAHYNQSGANNVFVGSQAGYVNETGSSNTFLGVGSGHSNISGSNNAAVGVNSGVSLLSGDYNVFMGYDSGIGLTSGTRNVIIGYKSGEYAGNGSNNVFLGYVAPIAGTSNSIILADGSGNQRFYIDQNGNAGIGLGNNVTPNNRLEIRTGIANNSGLRFTNLTSAFIPTTTASKFLTVDANGDVVLQNASTSGGSGTPTTITAGQNIVVTGNSTAGYTVSSPTTNTLVNDGVNKMTSTVNGVVAKDEIINTVVNSITSGELTTTVNGVSSAPVVLPANFDSDAQTLSIAGNQLTISNGNTVTLPTFSEIDGSVTNELQTLTQNPIQTTGTAITLSNGGGTVFVDGSETKIQAGTNVTVTGNGTIATPYVINSTNSGGSNCNIYSCDGTLASNRVVTMDNNNLIFNTTGSTSTTGGRVYIGNTTAFTTANFPTATGDYRLYVEGGVLTEKVKVALHGTANWADYVFANDYKLMPLNEVETFVKTNKHLPGVSSADKLVNEGLDLGEMQAKQMEKIEELTLYAIEQNKKIEKQEKEIEELKVLVKSLINKK